MKIAVIIDRIYPFYIGGYETLFYVICTKLSQVYEFDVYTSMEADHDRIENVNFIKIAKKRRYTNKYGTHSLIGSFLFFLSAFKVSRKIKGYDYVILNTIPYVGLGLVLKKIKAKKISYFHEAWYDYPKSVKKYAIRKEIRSILKYTDLAVSVSKSTSHSLVHNYRFSNVLTIPNGIDIGIINNIGSNEESYHISFLGRLSKMKNVSDIILAVNLLKKSGIDLKVAIIGDGEYKDALQNLSVTKGVSENIKFFGQVSDVKKYELLKSSKIFIMPSEREGFSIATLEAMACGCVPLVAKPEFEELFGISQFVKDGYNGLYFKVNDPEDLKEKISRLIEDRSMYEMLKENAMKEARKYDWTNIIPMFKQIFVSS
ncbi:MAG: glycosyltransferase family 4 protein [Candidatus Parvarchaeota archaeon]